MAKEKSLVEEAIIQMKNLEEAVAENAKGILASTMKEEIKELVKESLTEQEDEIEAEVDMEEPEMEDMDTDNEEDLELDMDIDSEVDTDDEMDMDDTIDLTDQSDEEVLRVFQLMDPEDKIIVKKDGAGNINLKDTESNKEYMIVQEGDEEMYEMWDDESEMDEEETIEDIVSKVFDNNDSEMEEYEDEFGMDVNEEDSDEIVYEIVMDDENYDELEERRYGSFGNPKRKDFRGDKYVRDDDRFADDEELYGIGDDDKFDSEEFDDFESYSERFPPEEEDSPSWFKGRQGKSMFDAYRKSTGKPFKVKTPRFVDMEDMEDMDEPMMESKITTKPKGVGMGNPNKKKMYSSKPNMEGGFDEKMKEGPKSVGTGNAKKVNVYKDKETLEGEFKHKPKKVETKEASRTLGSGKYFRKGGLPKPRAHSKANTAIKENENSRELQILREKNEEYRKALNIFRNKLNEVAVFNSNLAYATRLFTEHSTSKQEKINILRRFDSVESLKESKNLYKTIKDELSSTSGQPMNESMERVIEKSPSTGSAVNLIESKTYENPQFMRMKDLMAKLK